MNNIHNIVKKLGWEWYEENEEYHYKVKGKEVTKQRYTLDIREGDDEGLLQMFYVADYTGNLTYCSELFWGRLVTKTPEKELMLIMEQHGIIKNGCVLSVIIDK